MSCRTRAGGTGSVLSTFCTVSTELEPRNGGRDVRHSYENRAERRHVRGRADEIAPTGRLFGGHVRRRADDLPRARAARIVEFRQTEVGDFGRKVVWC